MDSSTGEGAGRAAGSEARARADCALGSGEWAEPPQYLPAMCWGFLGGIRTRKHSDDTSLMMKLSKIGYSSSIDRMHDVMNTYSSIGIV